MNRYCIYITDHSKDERCNKPVEDERTVYCTLHHHIMWNKDKEIREELHLSNTNQKDPSKVPDLQSPKFAGPETK
jgi:hypothetical protein